MKFFSPIIHLIHRTYSSDKTKSAEYIVHVVTYCDKANYRADGYDTLPTAADVNGIFNIDINIEAKTDLPDSTSITPVVHTIVFDESLLSSGDSVKVNVYLDSADKAVDPPRASTVVSPTEADEEDK